MFNPMFPNCEIWKQQQEFLSGRLYLPACADGHNVPHQIDPVYKMFYTECTQGYFFKLLCFGFIRSVFLIICDPVTYMYVFVEGFHFQRGQKDECCEK